MEEAQHGAGNVSPPHRTQLILPLFRSQSQKGLIFRPRPPPSTMPTPTSTTPSSTPSPHTQFSSDKSLAGAKNRFSPDVSASTSQSSTPSSLHHLSQHQVPSHQVSTSYQGYSDSVRPPPVTYVCFRCGVKGHWLQFCPTQGNKEFDKFRVKKTTGIPRSFLKTIATADGTGSDGVADGAELPPQVPPNQSVMVTPNGELVVAEANEQLWNELSQRTNLHSSAVTQDLHEKARELDALEVGVWVPTALKCLLCSGLYRDAAFIHCCKSIFCDACIRHHLTQQLADPLNVQKEMRCPHCHHPTNLDRILPNKPTRIQIELHLRKVNEELKHRVLQNGGRGVAAIGTTTLDSLTPFPSQTNDVMKLEADHLTTFTPNSDVATPTIHPNITNPTSFNSKSHINSSQEMIPNNLDNVAESKLSNSSPRDSFFDVNMSGSEVDNSEKSNRYSSQLRNQPSRDPPRFHRHNHSPPRSASMERPRSAQSQFSSSNRPYQRPQKRYRDSSQEPDSVSSRVYRGRK